jgi:alpha-beta hydrolase superfamily lysophospholipase
MTVDPRADHFAARGGLALHRVCWPGGPEPKAVVALVHGFAEYIERYDSVARWLVDRGYRVYGYDQRGHGQSGGRQTDIPSMEALLDDLERFLASIRRDEGDRPVILVGHSMGGLEVATLLGERETDVAAAILSGPFLRSARGSSAPAIAAAYAMAKVLPRLRLPASVDPRALSHDPDNQEAYRTDPRIPKSLSARMAWALLGAVRRVQDLSPRVRVPVLIVHGEDDGLCPIDGSREFHARLTSPGSEIRTYPDLRHEILYEPERDRVLEDVHAFISRHATPRVAA